jgi:hypothetical protein
VEWSSISGRKVESWSGSVENAWFLWMYQEGFGLDSDSDEDGRWEEKKEIDDVRFEP